MENQIKPTHIPEPKTDKSRKVAILLLVLAVGSTVTIYLIKHSQAVSIAHSNTQLSAKVATLEANIKTQDNINKGVVAAGPVYKDPDGGLGMVNGAVTFTLPEGWSRAAADFCGGGALIDSQVLCYDVASVTDASKTFDAGIAIYDYSSADGTAKQWVENKYFQPLSNTRIPDAETSDIPINGNSAFSYTAIAGSEPMPAYVEVTYVVVHDKYAAVITARLQDGGVYGGVKPYDYRSTYQPALEQFVQSARFKD